MIDVASDGLRGLHLFCGCIQNSFCPRCTQDEAWLFYEPMYWSDTINSANSKYGRIRKSEFIANTRKSPVTFQITI